MERKKCRSCGLVNGSADEVCRRCGDTLTADAIPDEAYLDQEARVQKRSVGKRLSWILGTTLLLLFLIYLSLLLTSDDLNYEQRRTVQSAISVLSEKGFTRQANMLSGPVKFRSTDSWWNRIIGHRNAYAATNFPFEVVTLYPEFFQRTVDDNERAAILLHESYHLFGAGEATALERVWREKEKLGWTVDNYEHSKAWNSTRELTASEVPDLFLCGPDGRSDCTLN